MKNEKRVTHVCNSRLGSSFTNDERPCNAYRTYDGVMHDICGEPCAWQMGKEGYGEPPNKWIRDYDISVSDAQNVEEYMQRNGIVGIKIVVDGED